MFLLMALLTTGCSPSSDDECVIYGESCGCSYYCGTTWEKDRANRGDQCLIGCVYTNDDTGSSLTSPLTDDDCVVVENECQWTDESKSLWPDLTLE